MSALKDSVNPIPYFNYPDYSMQRIVFLFALLFCIPLAIHAQYFKNFSIAEGLSQQDINGFYQDSYGFYWIGTNDGMNRFDGHQFKHYNLSDGENDANANLIGDIAGDNFDRLWVATHGDGIKCFNLKTEEVIHFRSDPANKYSIGSNRVHSLFVDSNQRLWVYTSKGLSVAELSSNPKVIFFKDLDLIDKYIDHSTTAGFFEDYQGNIWFYGKNNFHEIRYDKEVGFSMNQHDDECGIITEILEIHEGYYIIASESGLYSYCPKISRKLFKTTCKDDLLGAKLSADSTGLWLMSNNKIHQYKYKLDLKNAKLELRKDMSIPFREGTYKDLFVDNQSLLWLSGKKIGLGLYNPFNIAFKQVSINKEGVEFVCEDSFGKTWISTNNGAVYRVNEHISGLSKSEIPYKKVLNSNDITCIKELDNNGKKEIWVGTRLNGVFRIRLNRKGEIVYKPLNYFFTEGTDGSISSNYICDILQDSFGVVWIATYLGGINKVTNSLDNNKLYFEAIRAQDEKGIGLNSNTVRCLLEDESKRLFIGTAYGLMVKAPNSNLLFEINFANTSVGKSKIYIQSALQGKDGKLWFGTIGSGLLQINEDDLQTVKQYNVENGGFPNNTVKSITEDRNGNLWMATNIGVAQLNVSDGSYELYDKNNGLITYEFEDLAAFKLNSGELLFGSNSGANFFKPTRKKVEYNDSLKCFITEFKVNNTSINPRTNITGVKAIQESIAFTDFVRLGPANNSFSIDFTALNAVDYKNLVFSYKLEGYDTDWTTVSSGRNSVAYNNMSYADYRFLLKASTADGLCLSDLKSLDIHIASPFYRTTYAFAAYALVFILLVFFFQKYSLIRHKEKNNLLMEHYKHEKSEEIHQLKLQFFTSISHQFRTPLSLIYAPIEKLLKTYSNTDSPDKHYLKTIYNNSKYLLRLINQLLEFNKLEQNKYSLRIVKFDAIALLNNIIESFQEAATEKKISLVLNSRYKNCSIWMDMEKFEMIIYNLLSNALKHTHEQGTINIIVDSLEEEIAIEVRDNGSGIAKDDMPHIFDRYFQGGKTMSSFHGSGIGLYFCKRLVELHNGTIKCRSTEGEGSTFKMLFKKGNQHFNADQIIGEINVTQSINPLLRDYTLIKSEDELIEIDQKNKTIVLAEDDEGLRDFLKKELSPIYTVIEAENGKVAFELIKLHQPDLVLTDVMMPFVNGFNLCSMIRKNIETSHTPIIIISADTADVSKVQGMRNGADDYIMKPFSLEYLQLKIKRLLENKSVLSQKIEKEVNEVFNNEQLSSIDEELFLKIKDILDDNLTNSEISVTWMADQLKMSRSLLFLKMKTIANLGPNEFIRNYRLSKAVDLLDNNKDMPIKEVMFEVGFSSSSYFSKCFKAVYGCTPKDYLQIKTEEAIS